MVIINVQRFFHQSKHLVHMLEPIEIYELQNMSGELLVFC